MITRNIPCISLKALMKQKSMFGVVQAGIVDRQVAVAMNGMMPVLDALIILFPAMIVVDIDAPGRC
jgi:hypothetical protein